MNQSGRRGGIPGVAMLRAIRPSRVKVLALNASLVDVRAFLFPLFR